MRTRWKILIALLIFMAVSGGLSLLTLRVGPENSLDAYKDSLRAQGEKLGLAEMQPPPVPPEQNGRAAIESAFGYYSSGDTEPPYTMWMVAPGKAMAGWNQPEAYGMGFTNSWSDFATETAADAPALDFLRQAAEKPKLDFGLDYQKGASVLLPHLSPIKRSAQALMAASTLDLHNGDTASAATNLCVLLHLVKANEDENILISYLVRVAMTAIALGGTWDYLQATNTTDTQLAALQNGWTDLQFIQPMEKAIMFERAMQMDTAERARASSAEFDRLVGGSGYSGTPATAGEWEDQMKESTGKLLWRASWSYSEEMSFLQGDQIILTTLRAMATNQLWKAQYDSMQSQLAKVEFTIPGHAIFEKLEIPDYGEMLNNGYAGSVLMKTIRIEAARRVAITAIGLKRFQLRHGTLPDKLTELTPEILPAVLPDPIDGNPLRYQKNNDGTYLLYSIGEDGVDNGGDTTIDVSGKPSNFYWQNPHSRDWVWPQPATAAEIKYYHEHP